MVTSLCCVVWVTPSLPTQAREGPHAANQKSGWASVLHPGPLLLLYVHTNILNGECVLGDILRRLIITLADHSERMCHCQIVVQVEEKKTHQTT